MCVHVRIWTCRLIDRSGRLLSPSGGQFLASSRLIAGSGGFAVGAVGWLNVLSREWLPVYCCVPNFSMSMLNCLCPGCGLCGFPWVVPLGGLMHVLCCGLFSFDLLGCPWPTLGGLWVWFSFGQVEGLVLCGWIACWPVCESGLDWFSCARGMGLVIFGWFSYWHLFVFVAG